MKKTMLFMALTVPAFSINAQTRVPDEIGVLVVRAEKYENTPIGLRFDGCGSFALKACPKSSWLSLSGYVTKHAGKNAYPYQVDQDRFEQLHIFYRITRPTPP